MAKAAVFAMEQEGLRGPQRPMLRLRLLLHINRPSPHVGSEAHDSAPRLREDIMTKLTFLAALAALAVAGPALAGDPAAGEADFKKCKACHSITAPDGTDIQKGGKTGPNLYGIIGHQVASDPDFKYGDSIKTVGAGGAVWDEASLAAYVADPGGWLKETLGDDSAKTKMTFKLAKGGEDMAAYLASVAQ